MTVSSFNPAHIAIVMDGNGRWAAQRKLPVSAGHRAGVEALRGVLECCEEQGVKALTLFAFSSENWQRPDFEVSALMTLFSRYLDKEAKTLAEKHVRLRFIGRRDRFPPALLKKIEKVEKLTETNEQFFLNLAVDYGGQWDITRAARQLAQRVENGELKADDIDESRLAAGLCLSDMTAPDLFIRTSGERRISNFLLWQLSYTELYFTDVLWPDFDAIELEAAIACFRQRDRRYGGRTKQDSRSDYA